MRYGHPLHDCLVLFDRVRESILDQALLCLSLQTEAIGDFQSATEAGLPTLAVPAQSSDSSLNILKSKRSGCSFSFFIFPDILIHKRWLGSTAILASSTRIGLPIKSGPRRFNFVSRMHYRFGVLGPRGEAML